MTIRQHAAVIILGLATITCSCGGKQEPKAPTVTKLPPASYIKYVNSNEEGSDGLTIRLRLADADGNYTADDGKLSVSLYERRLDSRRGVPLEREVVMYEHEYDISAKEFRSDKSGDPLWTSARITFGQFRETPWAVSPPGQLTSHTSWYVRAQLRKLDGSVLKGEGY